MSIDSEKVTIKGHAWEKRSGKVTLRLKAQDQMRRPVAVTIDVHMTDGNEGVLPVAIQAKPGLVAGVINGIAEIAWAGGWRPQDLTKAIMAAVANHKRGRWDQTPDAPVPAGGSQEAQKLVDGAS